MKIIPTSSGQEFAEKISNLGGKYLDQIIPETTTLCQNETTTLCRYEKNIYANGEFGVNILESVRNKTVFIVSQPNNHDDLIELLFAIDAAKRSSAREIIAVIPMLPMSRQERRGYGNRSSISSRVLANILEVSGLDRVITMDVHNIAIEGFYNIPFDNIMPDTEFIDQIIELKFDNPIVVSPDLGATKRNKVYSKMLKTDMAIINKERLKANEISDMQLIGNVKDRNVFMFDDIIDTGGTILKASELLRDMGAKSINIFTTHGIFSNGVDAFINSESINNVFVTNTVNNVSAKTYSSKIKVLDVSESFYIAMLKSTK